MIHIYSDSTSDLSPDLIREHQVHIIPLHICLGDTEYRDGLDITPAKIYAWADANKTTPKTSAVSMEDAMEAIRPVMDAGDEMIIFTISSKMSTTANVFHLAAEELECADRVSIIDSQNLSTGIGLLVLKACDLVKTGRTRAEIVDTINHYIPKVRASFVVDTLTYLHRGGRCSSVAALAGSVLKLHPKIVVTDGSMGAGKKYRGKIDAVIEAYAKELEPELKNALPDRVFITHSGCDDAIVTKVQDFLESLNYFEHIYITRAGGVISSHCGPGTLGVLFISK